MISFVRGEIAEKNESGIVIDIGCAGIYAAMPSSDIARAGSVGSSVTVYTCFQIRDEQPELYAFLSKKSVECFNRLRAVSGIGPKAAMAILGTLSVQELALAVMCNDPKSIARAPGVGMKTAQRVVLELKDKLSTEEAICAADTAAPSLRSAVQNDTEAVNALIALGASPSAAQKTVMGMDTASLTTEAIIKEALRRMANGI